jgi:sporulation protein YlmC with PRC-barrel domain
LLLASSVAAALAIAGSGPAAFGQPGGETGGQAQQPEIGVQPPAPHITVQQPQPKVTIEPQGAPNPVQQQGQQAPQASQQLAGMGRGIVGKYVYSSNNENIGEIEDVVMGPNNQVQAALIDVGGFLGIGERRIAVPISDLKLDGDKLSTSMTKQQVEELPRYRSREDSGSSSKR